MQVATIEEDDDERRNVYEHDRMHLFYIGVTIVLAIITIYDRIIVDSMYGFDTNIQIFSLNRYPTAFTPSYFSMSLVWYVALGWQIVSLIYSLIGGFRRTLSNTYFYQYPCVMNKSCYFSMIIAFILILSRLEDAKYGYYHPFLCIFGYLFLCFQTFFVFYHVHSAVNDNEMVYVQNRYGIDIWLTRFIYQNGAALWASLAFYEYCLALINALEYSETMSNASASLFGGCVLLIFIIFCTAAESLLREQICSYTLIHWFVYSWFAIDLLSKTTFDNDPYSKFKSVRTIREAIFILIFIFSLTRFIYFIQGYRRGLIPKFERMKIYTVLDRPRRFQF